ncbi:MAG: FGGY-family carbohydrate kinase [Pirellulales bacterium]|nr:FGGY-family carbohydrate kinase [Pirellulales bacterium]
MSKILVLDLGTTYFKVCLFDKTGQLVGLQRVATPVEHPADGRAELPVSTFRQSLVRATNDLALKVGGLHDVAAVSFATQTNSFVLLDKRGEPLTPILLWTDQRALGLDNPLQNLATAPQFRAKTGVPRLDHHFLPAKMYWLQQHDPSTVAKTCRLALISDYLTWWMTGSHTTEAGAAGLVGLVDIHQLRWWPEACQQIGLPLEWLPTIVRAGTDLGPLRPSVAEAFGLPVACRFIVGCLDQYAGAIGAGNLEPGSISETTGTVMATVRCSDYFENSPRADIFQGPSFKRGQYYQMVFSEIAACLLEKYRNSLPDLPSFSKLDEWAASVPLGAEGLRLHPDAPNRKGADLFLNRRDDHTIGHEVRAILEAVAGELDKQVQLLHPQYPPKEVRSLGGAARSKLWLKIKSAKLGCTVQAVDCAEPTSLGAAMLARQTLQGTSLSELARKWVRVGKGDLPGP